MEIEREIAVTVLDQASEKTTPEGKPCVWSLLAVPPERKWAKVCADPRPQRTFNALFQQDMGMESAQQNGAFNTGVGWIPRTSGWHTMLPQQLSNQTEQVFAGP